MSEQLTDCQRFDQWLLEAGGASDGGPDGSAGGPSGQTAWSDHLAGCAECRQQWQGHEMLVAAFAGVPEPRLSPAFEAGLDRKLAERTPVVEPLRGWRRVAIMAYVAASVGALGWTLRSVPLPTIDLSAPWLPFVAFAAVPLTLMLAIAASRWIPGPDLRSTPRMLAV